MTVAWSGPMIDETQIDWTQDGWTYGPGTRPPTT